MASHDLLYGRVAKISSVDPQGNKRAITTLHATHEADTNGELDETSLDIVSDGHVGGSHNTHGDLIIGNPQNGRLRVGKAQRLSANASDGTQFA